MRCGNEQAGSCYSEAGSDGVFGLAGIEQEYPLRKCNRMFCHGFWPRVSKRSRTTLSRRWGEGASRSATAAASVSWSGASRDAFRACDPAARVSIGTAIRTWVRRRSGRSAGCARGGLALVVVVRTGEGDLGRLARVGQFYGSSTSQRRDEFERARRVEACARGGLVGHAAKYRRGSGVAYRCVRVDDSRGLLRGIVTPYSSFKVPVPAQLENHGTGFGRHWWIDARQHECAPRLNCCCRPARHG